MRKQRFQLILTLFPLSALMIWCCAFFKHKNQIEDQDWRSYGGNEGAIGTPP